MRKMYKVKKRRILKWYSNNRMMMCHHLSMVTHTNMVMNTNTSHMDTTITTNTKGTSLGTGLVRTKRSLTMIWIKNKGHSMEAKHNSKSKKVKESNFVGKDREGKKIINRGERDIISIQERPMGRRGLRTKKIIESLPALSIRTTTTTTMEKDIKK